MAEEEEEESLYKELTPSPVEGEVQEETFWVEGDPSKMDNYYELF